MRIYTGMRLERYGEFLMERAVAMVAESVVVYSDDLRRILRRVGTPVSDSLLAIEGEDHEVASNYLDITDDKEQVAFTPDKKAQALADQIKAEGLRKYTGSMVMPRNDLGSNLLTDMGIDPGGLDDFSPSAGDMCKVVSTHLSPAGTPWALVDFSGKRCVVLQNDLEDPMEVLWQRNRQRVRVGRLVRAMLRAAGREFTDAQVEEFVNKYKAAWDRSRDAFRNFELVSGDKIAHWYWYGNYAPARGGTLHNSCMARKPDSFFEIYTKNPDVCSLLVLKTEEDESKITGRALVWKTNEGFTFMDRVYTINESDVELFRDYAHSRGWYHKEDNDSCGDMAALGPEGQMVYKVSVEVKALDYRKFPYMDTMKYLEEGRQYFLSNDDESKWDKRLQSTTGGYDGMCETCNNSGRVECGRCDGEGKEDCRNCGGDGDVDCYECDGNGTLDCRTCDGKGELDEDDETRPCPDCDAKGQVECRDCGGKGEVECGDCEGDGTMTCRLCHGDGERDCPECQ